MRLALSFSQSSREGALAWSIRFAYWITPVPTVVLDPSYLEYLLRYVRLIRCQEKRAFATEGPTAMFFVSLFAKTFVDG